MVKISVFGHSPDAFSSPNALDYHIDNLVSIVSRQHKDDFEFLLNGEPGCSQWTGEYLIKTNIPFQIYLYGSPQFCSQFWTEEQQLCLNEQLNQIKSIKLLGNNYGSGIIETDIDNKDILSVSHQLRAKRDQSMVDDSNWVVVFWNGKHQGHTYQTMKYALENNKIVYNGFGLKLLDKNV